MSGTGQGPPGAQSPFAPRTLLRFIANTNPSATLSSFDSLPAVHGYRTYLAPEISPWDEEGFSSCSACPCHRAVATTPPKWITVSISFQSSMLPSPYGCRLGLQGFSLSGPPVRSLSLRPGNSLTSPRIALSMGFRCSVSLQSAIQATGLLTLTPTGLTPAEHASLNWTHNRT